MARCKPKSYFDAPIKAARLLSYLQAVHYGKYGYYYLVCLPMSDCSRDIGVVLLRRTLR